MCFKFFKEHSPLCCLRKLPTRGKLRILAIVLASTVFLGFFGYFVYDAYIDERVYLEEKDVREREGRRSGQSDLNSQQHTFFSASWSAGLTFAFVCSYSVVLYAAIFRLRFLILGWLGMCWLLPLIVAIELIYYSDVYEYYHFVAWTFEITFTLYEIWSLTAFETELKNGEEINLGLSEGSEEALQNIRTASMEIKSMGKDEEVGAVGQDASYRIAAKRVQTSWV